MSTDRPALTAYVVTKREGEDDFWTAIGAAFPHRDGDGYNLILNALPVGNKVVLRPPKETSDQTTRDRAEVRERRR